mgnify:CR=1 FL=1
MLAPHMEGEKKDAVEYRLSFVTRDEDTTALRAALSAHGAEIAKEQPLIKVRLAYPVKKQQFGFSGAFVLLTAPGALQEALAAVTRSENVLRAMATREFPGEEEKAMGIPPSMGHPRSARRAVRERVYRSQLSNEALEKKIEEILQ